MTLIAAFRTDRGAVICADSMESYDDFYVRVGKIERLDLGAYLAVIGGAGDEGGLIDGFADVLADEIRAWPVGHNEVALKKNVRGVLRAYYANEVKNFPVSRDKKFLQFVICIKPKDSEDVYLWHTDRTALIPIRDVKLVGYNTPIYEYEALRLYGSKGKPWPARAVALGIHLLALAKDTCRWVGGPTRVLVATERGIQRYEPEDVDVLEDRARKFNDALAELTLALPDVTVAEGSFIELLGSFEDRVLSLRGYYLERAANRLLDRVANDLSFQGDVAPTVPPDVFLARGADDKPFILSPEETAAFIMGAAQPLLPPDSDLEEQPPPSDSQTSEGQP